MATFDQNIDLLRNEMHAPENAENRWFFLPLYKNHNQIKSLKSQIIENVKGR